ncbi:LOW QUALITY PROTEIN: adenylate cyclase type 9-like [Manduca sexta]|uniref:LOW QUALITY PROTEIN: adenylate cyclase type 9-like n=1 Tax=Manduca sexta TaxID=7130 RepID=UPI00188FBBA7|nr:LOW QUALITY PROTEIN: adenylate cyclase type 9-like [Manduca sexta]
MSAPSGCVTCSDGSQQFDVKHDPDCSEGEDAQIRMAPHVQAYLARNNPTTNCCGLTIPIAFERAAPGTWWNPRFDSDILEGQYRSSSFRQIRLRFRFALLYILIFSISWFVYFVVLGLNGVTVKWPFLCSLFAGVLLITSVMLFVTFTNIYKVYTFRLSLVMALALCTLSLSLVTLTTQLGTSFATAADISQSGHFTMCIEILLIIYTLTPLPLFACVIIGLLYSIVFEVLNIVLHLSEQEWQCPGMFVRILLQLCVHIIGVHIYLMTFVRMRGTFMKVGQSLLVRRQLEMEKQLKEKMIHSVMPPKLATWLMEEQVLESDTSLKPHNPLNPRISNPGASDIKSLFRPFNMSCMDNVSILFADIVGFTRMSSNKGAEELVNILNDLFEKFDELCQNHGCEKISTLGDCYYCVSGCPEPRPDHATCCVEMGLGMIDAIQDFDRERGEGINMRVGVHTGTVLCGIVGTRRFKFDVWSNDVTFANKMESTGKPGRVHISEETSRFLGGSYILEEGEEVFGHKTYFIEGRQLYSPYEREPCFTPSNPVNLRLIISPAASPQSVLSFHHTPIIVTPKDDKLGTQKPESNNFLSPSSFNFRTKASSLPSILDSDTELDEKRDKAYTEGTDSSSKSPTSVGSYGKYTNKLKNWKVPRFLRKHSDTPLHEIKKQDLSEKSIQFLERGDDPAGLQSSNGYQQVPIVIESQDNKRPLQSNSKLHMPPGDHSASFDREIIDIRSYLSQSRCNMSPFARSSSYRSQYGRQNVIETPVSRARSSTLTTQAEALRPSAKDRTLKLPLPSPQPVRPHDDVISLCPSVNSRKDSGIRSTSRRSSIQQQIFVLNHIANSQNDMLQHRVSGYYTSSQSSLNECTARSRLPAPLSEQQVQSLQKLRKQSDLQLIRCVQDNARSGVNYFVQPPLNRLTLCFKSLEIEKHYRDKAHRSDDCEDFPPTLTTSRFNTALDILVSAIIFLAVSCSIFILYDDWRRTVGWFVFFTFIEVIAMMLCVYRHYLKWKTRLDPLLVADTVRRSVRIFRKLTNWYPWHLSGSLLISLPILVVLINFSCQNTTMTILRGEQSFYVYLLCISIVHFCNFLQMNWLVKNTLVTLYAGLFLFFAVLGCHEANTQLLDADINLKVNAVTFAHNYTDYVDVGNDTLDASESQAGGDFEGMHHKMHLTELYLDVALLLMLVWFLNHEFEISYRLSFYSKVVANRDKQRVQNMRNQADWLLHNIIPRHVADQLKNTAKYSENHKDVGIIFASIVNFNEMYDESYLKGKEYLRVLNELIADFDELLERPQFQHVEKIKTIGSTFMAASGLNPDLRHASRGTYDHLYQLMDFALEMQKVVDNFNQDLLEFDFILRIGYNFGDVTAGVIGTTKLYYDIWGDAVNIASRMDSTGVIKRIQVGEACIPVLSSRYEFEHRGSVYVKGKDNMNVYLVVGKKDT